MGGFCYLPGKEVDKIIRRSLPSTLTAFSCVKEELSKWWDSIEREAVNKYHYVVEWPLSVVGDREYNLLHPGKFAFLSWPTHPLAEDELELISPLLQHILLIICNGRRSFYNFFCGWFHFIFTNKGRKTEVRRYIVQLFALWPALPREHNKAKPVAWDAGGTMVGKHYGRSREGNYHANVQSNLRGRLHPGPNKRKGVVSRLQRPFRCGEWTLKQLLPLSPFMQQRFIYLTTNGWSAAGKLLVHCDEFTISKDSMPAFKTAVTEPKMQIKTKYLSAFQCKDFRNYVFTCNEFPLLSAAQRRVVTFQLNCSKVGNTAYFEGLMELIENPAVAGIMYRYLMNWEEDFNPSEANLC